MIGTPPFRAESEGFDIDIPWRELLTCPAFAPASRPTIAEYLDRDYVVSETRAQRDWLAALRQKALKKDKAALAELRQHKMTTAQLARAIAALDDALARAKTDKKHPQGSAYIPNDPVICGLQTGLTQIAVESGQVRANAPAPVKATGRRGRGRVAVQVVDTSPMLRLRQRPAAPKAAGTRAARALSSRGRTPATVWSARIIRGSWRL